MPFLGDCSMHIYDVRACLCSHTTIQASARLSFFLRSHAYSVPRNFLSWTASISAMKMKSCGREKLCTEDLISKIPVKLLFLDGTTQFRRIFYLLFFVKNKKITAVILFFRISFGFQIHLFFNIKKFIQ